MAVAVRALVSAGLVAALAAAGPAVAAGRAGPSQDSAPVAPAFELPVRCDTRTTCFIQNYVDAEPGPGARDLTCGPLTYDGHDGIDIRQPGPQPGEAGVAVLAAAAGSVRAVRDGMPDVSVKKTGKQAVDGREAGNAVVLTHGNGWETQYSHLRMGSVAVRPGDTVRAGALLGEIGLSGNTEFPHVQFSIRRDGIALDPFSGLPPGSGCGGPGKSLWSAAAERALPYRAGGLLAAGFTTATVDLETALSGSAASAALSPTDPALVFWVASWGLRQGDVETIRVLRPDGTVLSESQASVPGDKAQWLRYTGRKRRDAAWPAGRYRGEYRVIRRTNGKDAVIVETAQTIEVR